MHWKIQRKATFYFSNFFVGVDVCVCVSGGGGGGAKARDTIVLLFILMPGIKVNPTR